MTDSATLGREVHLLRALMFGLFSVGVDNTSGAVRGALAALANDRIDWAACRMAFTAITALVTKNPRARADVQRCDAYLRGCDPTRDATSILDLAHAVEAAAEVYRCTDRCELLPARVAVTRDLAEHLVNQFGNARGLMPDPDDLGEWLSRHSPKGARGKLTTAGIVACIVRQGRLFNTSYDDLGRTLARVDAVLARAERTERKLRESTDRVS